MQTMAARAAAAPPRATGGCSPSQGGRAVHGACAGEHAAGCRLVMRATARGGSTASRPLLVVAMADDRRVARVSKQLKRIIGTMLVSDKTVRDAVSPEERLGVDGSLTTMASVTQVVVSNDLQVAKVYLSIFGDELGKANARRGLMRLEGYIRREVGREMQIRLTPEIRISFDDSLVKGTMVLDLLARLQADRDAELSSVEPSVPSRADAGGAAAADSDSDSGAVGSEGDDVSMRTRAVPRLEGGGARPAGGDERRRGRVVRSGPGRKK